MYIRSENVAMKLFLWNSSVRWKILCLFSKIEEKTMLIWVLTLLSIFTCYIIFELLWKVSSSIKLILETLWLHKLVKIHHLPSSIKLIVLIYMVLIIHHVYVPPILLIYEIFTSALIKYVKNFSQWHMTMTILFTIINPVF